MPPHSKSIATTSERPRRGSTHRGALTQATLSGARAATDRMWSHSIRRAMAFPVSRFLSFALRGSLRNDMGWSNVTAGRMPGCGPRCFRAPPRSAGLFGSSNAVCAVKRRDAHRTNRGSMTLGFRVVHGREPTRGDGGYAKSGQPPCCHSEASRFPALPKNLETLNATALQIDCDHHPNGRAEGRPIVAAHASQYS